MLFKPEVRQMFSRFVNVTNVVVYTDGACTNNPGPTGAGACFFKKVQVDPNNEERLEYICHS